MMVEEVNYNQVEILKVGCDARICINVNYLSVKKLGKKKRKKNRLIKLKNKQ